MSEASGSKGKLSQNEIAKRGWEWQNSVQPVRNVDDLFRFNEEEHQRMVAAKPWEKDVNFFKTVRISALAVLKMVMHARSGGNIEVMGLMLGRADAGSMIVMDAFALPVEGTETRVNAQAAAYEYMTQYLETQKQVGRVENVIGWYHSHPGYGCWLSGIDVETQRLNQQFQEPWLAVVIDPIRTIAAGQVDLGAFRTYPKGFIPPEEKGSEHRNIPLKKVEDFGSHYKEYYQLGVSYFKTSSDKRLLNQLWNQYWVATLSSSPWFKNLGYNIEQTQDVAAKMDEALKEMRRGGGGTLDAGFTFLGSAGSHRANSSGDCCESELNFRKAIKDGRKVACEAMQAVMMQIVKRSVFNDFETTGAAVNGGNASAIALETAMPNDFTLPDLEGDVMEDDEEVVDENDQGAVIDGGGNPEIVAAAAAVDSSAPLAVQEQMNVD
ncbi:COP9 signalosome complex subunit 5 [Hypsibius exemplaris]|uniref:COP9 signalosome complex subunit 5 n=1 Tax=Hypsibius exemplaris TaxID=2072580 RepID=A0A1W0WNW1_HYPEX|nr:COP9 signalosome complex subunit 5 [Hypsibius exemplaris]